MFRLSTTSLLALTLLSTGCDEPAAKPAPTPSATAAPAPAATATATAEAAAPKAPETAEAPAAKPEWITAQHILVAYKGAKNAPPTVKRTKAEAKQRAEEAAGKAKRGDDFIALVKEYSDDTATLDRLGSVGKFKPEGMVKPFSDAAFALKVEGVSEPVETPFGFHIIKRNQ